MGLVKFIELTSTKYEELKESGELEDSSLYFVSDSQQLYKGEVSYTNLPSVSKNAGAVDNAVTNVNFTGEGFVVESDPDNPGRVNVSMPFNLAKMNSSYYNSTGGTTSPSVASIGSSTTNGTANTYQSRYVSLSNDESYKLGDWTSVTTRNVLNKGVTTISYSTADFFWIPNKNTTFKITLIKGDGSEVVETTSAITGNNTYSTTNCSVVISDFTEDFMGNKAKAKVNINVANMLGGAGRFSIKISHVDGGVEYTKVQNNLFYDDNQDAGTIESTDVTINEEKYKWLSGIKYLTTGTKFNVNLNNVNGVFNKSFLSSVGTISGSAIANTSYTAEDVATAAGTTLASVKDNVNATKLTKVISATSSKYLSSISVSATCSNGWNSNTSTTNNSLSLSNVLDTYAAASTSLAEEFQDENYRLKSDLSTKWDSTIALGASDLQVGKGTWLVPSDTSVSQSYVRNFAPSNSSTTATSNFTFTLAGKGLTEANLSSGAFGLEISLDGINWFTFAKDKADVLTNGSGIREYKDTAKLSGTSGTLRGSFTAGMNTGATTGKGGNITGYGIYARITIKGTGIELNSISVAMV